MVTESELLLLLRLRSVSVSVSKRGSCGVRVILDLKVDKNSVLL